MITVRLASVAVSTLAFAAAATGVRAQRQGSITAGRTAAMRQAPAGASMRNMLRCVRSSEGRVTIYNGGPAVLPKGTEILVHAKDADDKADGTGGVPTDVTLAVGAKWLEPIKFGAAFTHCNAKIMHVPA